MEITDLHVLNEGLFKRFTGCVDKITYRGLYQKKIKSFVPRCVPHTVCNTFPRMNGNSAAMRTRAIVLHLDSKFITEKDPEFEIIKDKSEEEREAYMAQHHWYWANL
jgi:phage/plasmid-associated DNA primase